MPFAALRQLRVWSDPSDSCSPSSPATAILTPEPMWIFPKNQEKFLTCIQNGEVPLLMTSLAEEGGGDVLAKVLLGASADVNAKDDVLFLEKRGAFHFSKQSGIAPLFFACRAGNVKLSSLLLECNGEIDSKENLVRPLPLSP